jgi:hypothetical protein
MLTVYFKKAIDLLSLSLSLLISSYALVTPSADAEIYRRLDFEGLSHINKIKCYNARWCLVDDFVNEKGKRIIKNYGTDIKGRPNKPWLSNIDSFKGRSSLAIQYPSNLEHPPLDKSQKIEYWYGMQDFHRVVWTGFAVRFGSGRPDGFVFQNPDSPKDWVIFAQWWQGNGIPPMKLVVENPRFNTSDNLVWRLRVHNNNNTKVQNGLYAMSSGGEIAFQGTIQKGVWNTFVLESRFEPVEFGKQGYVKIWQNGYPVGTYANKPDARWDGYIGYNLMKANQPRGLRLPSFQQLAFKAGIYRSLQNKSQTIFFDQINVSYSQNGFRESNPQRW